VGEQSNASPLASPHPSLLPQVLQALLTLWRLQQQQPSNTLAIRTTVSDLGPLWVKLGQTLAVRPDVVGTQLAAALSGLQESAPPFPTATAAQILQEELGVPLSEVFAWWSHCPVASASLGQVYQAALWSGGRIVAVKVRGTQACKCSNAWQARHQAWSCGLVALWHLPLRVRYRSQHCPAPMWQSRWGGVIYMKVRRVLC
jgi:hypothetical protein